MGKFVDGVWFEVIHCAGCGMTFGMSTDFIERRRADHKNFYCPSGHTNYYSGKSEAEKLRERLAQQEAATHREQVRANALRIERDQVAKAHRKMRQRVMNGVCPCCTRSFDNLRAHMETKHPDFGKEKTLRALREAFGLRQADVASEAGVSMMHVSMFERGKPVAGYAREALEGWLDSQSVA